MVIHPHCTSEQSESSACIFKSIHSFKTENELPTDHLREALL